MRRPRNFQTDRYYHLVNRVVHRAFYLDEYEPWHEVTPPLPLHQWGQPLSLRAFLDRIANPDAVEVEAPAEDMHALEDANAANVLNALEDLEVHFV